MFHFRFLKCHSIDSGDLLFDIRVRCGWAKRFLAIALLTFVVLNVPAMSTMAQGQSRRITATGELTVVHTDDFDNGHGEFVYFLKDKSRGKTFRLKFDGEPPGRLISGDI